MQYLIFIKLVPCTNNGNIRLVGGTYYGRVEVCAVGIWSSICRDTYWSNEDASVICKQLGFSPYGKAVCIDVLLLKVIPNQGSIAVPVNWYYEHSNFFLLSGLNCTGTEDDVLKCPFVQSTDVCSSANDANVVCPGRIQYSIVYIPYTCQFLLLHIQTVLMDR